MNTGLLLKELQSQKVSGFKGNIYHWTQVSFAFHSNNIEGSTLSEEQVEMMYTEHSFLTKSETTVYLDDLTMTMNHFKLFDYMLEHVNAPLSMDLLIDMNLILRRGTFEENSPRQDIGKFKIASYVTDDINAVQTYIPQDVVEELSALLEDYHGKRSIALRDIIDFHVQFENILPFGIGNGYIGRMVMFKECLLHDIMPFIILEQDKIVYLKGIKDYGLQPNLLLEMCHHEQVMYEDVCILLLNYE